jgi:hypothetical protein
MSTTPSEPEKASADAAESAPKPEAKLEAQPVGEAVGAEGVGEGAPRYAENLDEVPAHGSEQSWSAAPNPGYQTDPDSGMDGKRLAAGVLVGGVALAAGIFAGYSLLTAKSPNGNGTAAWTADITKDGAVIQGINAQNDVGTNAALPSGLAQQVHSAVATCNAVTGNNNQLTTTTGTAAGIGNWASKATPSINALRADAANLKTAAAAHDPAAIATSAQAMCTSLVKVSSLPAMPDAAGSAAWAAGITAYAAAANDALKGASGDAAALTQSGLDLSRATTLMDTLAARIIAAP